MAISASVALYAATAPPLTILAADYTPVWVAVIAGCPALVAVILSHRRAGKKMEQIHVLVNSRLTEALDEISALKGTLVRKDLVIADQADAAEVSRAPVR